MCGISFALLSPSASPERERDPRGDRKTLQNLLENRGPDSAQSHTHIIERGGGHTRLEFFSTVLHLRGDECVRQPLVSGRFVLQWNGQVYGGLKGFDRGNDTRALFDALHLGDASPPQIISAIRGEYAFVLLDILQKRLYYGRDVFGRRSLLHHLSPTTIEVASVAPFSGPSCSAASDGMRWVEVPANGIWSVDLTDAAITPSVTPWSSVPRISPAIHDPAHECGRAGEFLSRLEEAFGRRLLNIPGIHACDLPRVAILFSGGVDSAVMAAVADRVLLKGVPVDLLNVAFHNDRFLKSTGSANPDADADEDAYCHVPDRQSGLAAWGDLQKMSPDRPWNFVCVNVPSNEYDAWRDRVAMLMRPSATVMDLSIAIALWFASRGVGVLARDGSAYASRAKVLLVGMGADEQLGGYGRHRSAYEHRQWPGLLEEMQLELDRIATRNLGRDDRCIADHGREARFPFLDEDLVAYLSSLPLSAKCDFALPRGRGEKRLLRDLAKHLGFSDQVAFLPKRAIQFGAKTAKMGDGAEKGQDRVALCMQ